MKKTNGITLIALVITIIVLLILAGVSIATISGENGIVTKAKEAAERTDAAEKKEQEDLSKIESWIDESTAEGSFPYGTLYRMSGEEVGTGIVIYEDGSMESYGKDGGVGTYTTLDMYLDAENITVEGNSIVINGMNGINITISSDYSTITMSNGENQAVYTKTTETVTQCAHEWEPSDNTEINDTYHGCLKCDVYQAHTWGAEGNCDRCGVEPNV